MQQLLSPDTFEFFARYLLAGFVFLASRARFIVGERPQPTETIIEAVILSLINQLIYLAIISLMPSLTSTVPARATLFAEVLLLPAITGGVSGWLLGRNWMPDGFRRLIMPVSRPVSQAYQHAFAMAETPCFVLIAFPDNREVYGYFGERSIASTDLETGGIYLERLYMLGEGGDWIEASPSRSAWLSLRDARSIEFFEGVA